MDVFQYHVFVCDQRKAEGLPCCGARGGAAILDAMRSEVARQGLAGKVLVTMCGSLGLCDRGPNMVVYPEGAWYSGVQPSDVTEIVESHFKEGQPVERLLNRDVEALRTELAANRMKMLAGMKRREEVGVLPDSLQQTIRGFQESRVALTALELDVFTSVADGRTAADVARAVHADARAVEMLLNALVAMGLLDKRDNVFANTPASASYLAAGGRHDSRTALLHTAHLWTTWSRLTDAVRAGTAVRTESAGRDTEAFIAAMHKNASERAPIVVGAVVADGAQRMLDVGGGSGAYSIAFAQANPRLQVDVLDVAEVIPIAERHVAAANLKDRVRLRSGDLRRDDLGRSQYDLILLSAICHMLSPDENRDLLVRCHAAAAPGGRVVIQDFILNAAKTAPKAGALFALNMLVGTTAGSAYSEAEYADWLRDAGFSTAQHVSLHAPTGLMIGVKSHSRGAGRESGTN